MGLRTHRYGPTATKRRGASHGPGVPRPTMAKNQRQEKYRAAPTAMKATAGHATGSGVAPPRVEIHQGTHMAPAPGTTTVNKRFRTSRLIALRLLPRFMSCNVTKHNAGRSPKFSDV